MTAGPREILERGEADSPPLVLLHGLGAGPRMWKPQLEALSRGYHVVAPELPGFGDDAEEEPFTLARAVESVSEVIGERAGGRAHVCGLALGALVAARLALDHPDRVHKLILCGAQLRPNRFTHALQGAIAKALPERVLVQPGHRKKALLAAWREIGEVDLMAEVSRIGAPTMVMCGSRERGYLPTARKLAEDIPGAMLTVVPSVGRGWNHTRPELFNEIVTGFLDDATDGPLDPFDELLY